MTSDKKIDLKIKNYQQMTIIDCIREVKLLKLIRNASEEITC